MLGVFVMIVALESGRIGNGFESSSPCTGRTLRSGIHTFSHKLPANQCMFCFSTGFHIANSFSIDTTNTFGASTTFSVWNALLPITKIRCHSSTRLIGSKY
eukprot:TRINITY_DN642_c0_g5_i2.p1 TRINITY_DN642_c0_g5~~TRINITY_DN642_c0_g5_i2.p1  ORF type:complete len:101 (+),score=8.98 TRINITY_DN642_c0_g5_i2:628-930(+)